MHSALCIAVAAVVLALMLQVKASRDVSEDQRNSFPLADQRQLAALTERLAITLRLAPEDPRYLDLQSNFLAKLERVMPHISISLGAERRNFSSPAGDDTYGEIKYRYGARSDISRSTNPQEILRLLYGLAGVSPPAPILAAEYPGYPHVADGRFALVSDRAADPDRPCLVAQLPPADRKTGFYEGGRHEQRREIAFHHRREHHGVAAAGVCRDPEGGPRKRNGGRRAEGTSPRGRHLAHRK